jgi:hypothetical protein
MTKESIGRVAIIGATVALAADGLFSIVTSGASARLWGAAICIAWILVIVGRDAWRARKRGDTATSDALLGCALAVAWTASTLGGQIARFADLARACAP